MAGTLIAFNACKDDDPAPLTKEEAQAQLTDINTQTQSVKSDFMDKPGVKIEEAMYNLPNLPFYGIMKSPAMVDSKMYIEKVKEKALQFSKTKKASLIFDFYEYVGTWEYNSDSPYQWNYSDQPTNMVVIKFPYPITNATNNVTVTYYDYTESNGRPTGMKRKIEYNGTVVSETVFTSSFTLTSSTQSTSTTIGIYNITEELNYSISETQAIVKSSFTFKKNSETLYKEYAEVTITGGSNQVSTITIDGATTILSIEFRFNVKFKSNDVITISTNPNDYITMSIYTTSGEKLADLKYEYNSAKQSWVLWLYFNNGDKVIASEYINDLIDEEIFYDLLDIYYSFVEQE